MEAALQQTQLSNVKLIFFVSHRSLKIQKHLASIVSMFYFLCLYKTGNFHIIIKKSSFIFRRYDLFVYFCSFSCCMVSKIVDFCY